MLRGWERGSVSILTSSKGREDRTEDFVFFFKSMVCLHQLKISFLNFFKVQLSTSSTKERDLKNLVKKITFHKDDHLLIGNYITCSQKNHGNQKC